MPRQSQSTTNASSRRSDFSLFTRVKARKPAGSLSLPELEQWIRYNKRPVELANLPDVRALTKEIRAHYERHGKDAGYQTRKKGLPVFTPAGIFSQRNKSGLEKHSSFIPLDFDDLPSAEDKATAIEQLQGLAFIAIAARSVADGVWALAKVNPTPTNALEHTAAWNAVVAGVRLQLEDIKVDRSGKDLARARYLAADPSAYVNQAASPLPWSAKQKARSPRPSAGKHALPLVSEVELMLERIDPDCDRLTWVKIGAALRREGYPFALWKSWSMRGHKFDPEEDCTPEQWERFANFQGNEARIGTVIMLARKGGYLGHPQGSLGLRAEIRDSEQELSFDELASYPPELENIHNKLSELHHARRMLERHATDLLSAVDVDTRTLHVLQGNGTWLPGDDQVRRLYWETASYWLKKVVEHRDFLPGFVNNDKAFADTIKAFRATERNRACIEGIRLAGSVIAHWEKDPHPPQKFRELTQAKKSELDADLRYLGCNNGVVDLHTGALLGGQEAREKLVTRNTGVGYGAGVTHPAVDKLTAHLSDKHRQWLLSCLGYALRGYPDRTLYLLVGPPGGGKSTFLSAVRLALGEYADALAEGALTQRNVNSATAGLSPEMEAFTRCRIVIDSDLEASAKLSTGRLKKLAGGDEMKWRPLHRGYGDTRRVSATMFISINDDQVPRLTMDSGLYDRLRPLPYPAVPVAQRDSGLRTELEDPIAKEAMLALLVRYAVKTSQPPAITDEVYHLRNQLRRESVGAGFYDWATTALDKTSNSPNKISTAELWGEACAVAGNDSPWGYNRRSFVPALRSLLELPPARKMWINGKVSNGWNGLRLATGEEVEKLTPGESISDWIATHLAKTENPDDRTSTTTLWRRMVEDGGDPPWGRARRSAFATVRETLSLPPASKIRIDGQAVNGWKGLKIVK